MLFHFYESTSQPHECEEYVEFDDWNEAVQHGHDLSNEWRNQVRIYEDGKEYSELVGYTRAKHIEIGVNRKVNKIIQESEQREQRAQERATHGH